MATYSSSLLMCCMNVVITTAVIRFCRVSARSRRAAAKKRPAKNECAARVLASIAQLSSIIIWKTVSELIIRVPKYRSFTSAATGSDSGSIAVSEMTRWPKTERMLISAPETNQAWTSVGALSMIPRVSLKGILSNADVRKTRKSLVRRSDGIACATVAYGPFPNQICAVMLITMSRTSMKFVTSQSQTQPKAAMRRVSSSTKRAEKPKPRETCKSERPSGAAVVLWIPAIMALRTMTRPATPSKHAESTAPSSIGHVCWKSLRRRRRLSRRAASSMMFKPTILLKW
mmetsp:Transcript_10369/g.30452  ORF Transcript_10369/g.30452 Transcript_10369/m.30452 type:complete len:287 (-) Transcript_10369:576-1436(-)